MAYAGLVIVGVLLAFAVGLDARHESESPSTLETAEFMKDVKQECRNATGDDRAFKDLVAIMNSDTPRCFLQHVNMSYLQAPIDEMSMAEQSKLLGGICGQLEKAVVCIDPVVDAIKPCMDDEDDMQILTKIVDTVPQAIKMICNNSGAMLLELREPLSRSCAVELAPAIDDCMDVLSNSTMTMDLKNYTLTECKEIYKMRDCLDRKIRDCGALTYLELFGLFYRNLLSITPCKMVAQDG